jgi:hypothetical protein
MKDQDSRIKVQGTAVAKLESCALFLVPLLES